jgi:ribosome maturation factor RimP
MDAHAREAAGAVAGMVETYGQTLSVGDWVQGTAGQKRFSGMVAEIDRDRVVVEIDGAWLTVSMNDIEQDG